MTSDDALNVFAIFATSAINATYSACLIIFLHEWTIPLVHVHQNESILLKPAHAKINMADDNEDEEISLLILLLRPRRRRKRARKRKIWSKTCMVYSSLLRRHLFGASTRHCGNSWAAFVLACEPTRVHSGNSNNRPAEEARYIQASRSRCLW